MTQLFDTATYDYSDQINEVRRHLRSIPAGVDVTARTTQWRLDSQTIESGRKGIEAARAALQDAARTASAPSTASSSSSHAEQPKAARKAA